jgi:dTDP-4-amino-4,6-dideoxygalactose transaminase
MNYQAVKDFCKSNNIICFEDAAQSFGASHNNIKSGSAGLCSALSFSPSKPSPTFGFLGAMATDDKMIFDQVNDAKKHGMNNGSVGLNSNPSSALVLQLQHSMKLNEMCEQHRADHAKAYDEGLQDVVDIPPRQGRHSWSKYVIRTDKRNKLMRFMSQYQIETKIHYAKLLPQYKMYHKHKLYPVASKLAETSLSLPIDPWMTNSERDSVIDAVRRYYK